MLTLLINKTIMNYGKENPINTETNLRHRQNALRVFIAGLNGLISGTLFSAGATTWASLSAVPGEGGEKAHH